MHSKKDRGEERYEALKYPIYVGSSRPNPLDMVTPTTSSTTTSPSQMAPQNIAPQRMTATQQEDRSKRRGKKNTSINTNPIGISGRKKRLKQMQYRVIQTLLEATVNKKDGGLHRMVFQMNRGLFHVLEIIDKAPNGKISTRELLRAINSYNMHKLLKEAERLGFVKRETERMPEGKKGGVMVVNSLTEDGRILLGLSDQYFERH